MRSSPKAKSPIVWPAWFCVLLDVLSEVRQLVAREALQEFSRHRGEVILGPEVHADDPACSP